MTTAEVQVVTEKLVLIALILQSHEDLRLWWRNGFWPWRILRREHSSVAARFWGWILEDRRLPFLIGLRLITALLAFAVPIPGAWLILFFCTLAIAVRWRGAFNGGADSMSLVLIGALTVAHAFPDRPAVVLGSLWFVSVQVLLSYVLAGISKLKTPGWRSGEALIGILSSPQYQVPARWTAWARSPGARRWTVFLSSSLIVYEISFALLLIQPQWSTFFVSTGLVFHLINFCVFGLNRFFWIWIAAYPAFLHCFSLL